MEGDLDVACLSESEPDSLLSLLSIRASRKTVASKKSIATDILSTKKLSELQDPNFEVKAEYTTIKNTVKELENLITDFKAPQTDTMYKTILNRLIFFEPSYFAFCSTGRA